MFFLVIFSLVTLVDPFPTTVSNKVAESQFAPAAPEKLSTFPDSVVKEQNSISHTAHLFYKDYISTESSSLPENHAHKNVSTVTTSIIIPVPSSKMEKRNSDAISESVENGSTFQEANINDDKKIETQKPGHKEQQPLSPLVLKLDRRYTPVDIVEYIFTTGDEKGFTQGVAEMLEDGQLMMSRDDVLVFLEAVQMELTKLRKETESKRKNE